MEEELTKECQEEKIREYIANSSKHTAIASIHRYRGTRKHN